MENKNKITNNRLISMNTQVPFLTETSLQNNGKYTDLFNFSSLFSSGLESLPLTVSLSVAVAVLSDCVDCGGTVAVRGSLALAEEDWASVSYFYKYI